MIIRPVKAEEERSSSIPSLGNKRGHGGGGSGARGHRGRGLHRGESSSHASGGYRKGKGSKALLPTVQLSPRQRERALGLLAVDVEDEEGEDVHNVGAERMSRMMLAQDDVRFVSFRQELSPALAGLSCMRSFIHFHALSFPFLPPITFLSFLYFDSYFPLLSPSQLISGNLRFGNKYLRFSDFYHALMSSFMADGSAVTTDPTLPTGPSPMQTPKGPSWQLELNQDSRPG